MRAIAYAILLILHSSSFAQPLPRPEYPQPQFQRSRWLSLNGPWEFEFDDNNHGLSQNWAASIRKFSKTITVPFCFESPNSGIHDTSFHPWVWYRRSLNIPADWKGQRILLHFGAVDYRATVWINGKLAGSHEGGGTPFKFDITDLLSTGPNNVTLRAEDPPTDRTIPRGKQYWQPKSRGIFYTRTSGIWQPVWLEATGSSYLDRVRITPSLTGQVRFEARLGREEPALDLHATISHNGVEVAAGSARILHGAAHMELRVPNPVQWTLTAPTLYDITFQLRRQNQTVDTVESYFGFRTVAVENGRFLLNGRPTYVKMVLDQGYWPESLLTPPSDEAMKFDIEASKKMGFNGARKHQKIEDPRFLYWADKLGFLVSGEMANAYEFDAPYVDRFTREWIEAVERDYNHPSIVMWVPINESWGTPNLRDPQQQNHLRANYWLTKSLDPTRPVIENDGWEHVDVMDLFTIHDYAATGARLYEKYKDLGKPGARIPDNGRAIFAPGFTYNGSPFFLSEFGGIAYIPPGTNVPPESWGYSGVEKTPEAALARLTGLYDAIARIPAFIGLCYTQITDVEQEVNGLLTYDRKYKFDPAAIKALNDRLQ
ncbi:MAG: glycoside hydrolase family 2 [Acidimicrobiia bacterium]|nr:glycoside hydrolase family 2 [Acidimicrobiia bacterium]